MPSLPASLTRRQLLIGGGAALGAVLLGACGGDDDDPAPAAGDPGSSDGGDGAAAGLVLVQFFGGPMFTPGQVRLPFGLGDVDGLIPTERTPEQLTVTVLDPDGRALGDPVTVARHAEGLPRAYFPYETSIDAPGFYTLQAEAEGETLELSFQVHEPSQVQVIQPGAALPAIATPTVTDAHGVDPICTNDPVCSLHEVTLEEAVGAGQPVALLVSTPAFCQLAICGPVLDVLLEVAPSFPDVRFLHTEVFADPYESLDRYAPVVDALGLHFEPCLVLADATGTVVRRLDTIYDKTELEAALNALVA